MAGSAVTWISHAARAQFRVFRHAASTGVALAAYLDLTSRKTRKVHAEAR
jgi:hypothetical protein